MDRILVFSLALLGAVIVYQVLSPDHLGFAAWPHATHAVALVA